MIPLRNALLPVLVLLSAVRAPAQGDLQALWSDATFRKQFVGSYGINADVEPRVTTDEVAVLEKVRPLMADQLPKAETILRERTTGRPDGSALLDFTLGGVLFQQEKLDEALVSYQRAVDKFPSFRRAWRNLGLIHVRAGRFEDAVRAFTRMIELGGADAYAFGLLGYSYASLQDFQAAEASYRNALLLQPDNTEWRLGLTRCVFRQQKFEDAATLLDSLLARFPDKGDFWLLQAHAYLGMKQPLRAAADLEALDQIGKSTLDSLYTLGDVYANENLPELAAHAYQRAIAADPAQPVARALRAEQVLLAHGAIAPARAVLGDLRKLVGDTADPADRSKVLKIEARLSMAEGGAAPETATVLEEIVRLEPLDGEALLLLGQYYARHDELDRAILWYERAEGIEAVEANARIRHAQVLLKQNRWGDALPLLRRAQELKPREDVARLVEQVERLAKRR
jgi:tetratricopeptide (TPR) repeat protein